MNIAVIVTTAPRAVRYLEGTLSSLHAAGFQSVAVIEDAVGDGINANYRNALASIPHDADAILVCQDDIVIAKGTADWLQSQSLPDGVLSLYCAQPYIQDDTGWWEFPLQPTRIMKQPWARVYGALAMLWRRDDAVQFVRDKPAFDGRNKVDQLIGKWCMNRGRPLWIHSPSLVEHIGAVSTCGGTGTLTPSRIAGQWCQDVGSLRE